jgi:hypothetical protein
MHLSIIVKKQPVEKRKKKGKENHNSTDRY